MKRKGKERTGRGVPFPPPPSDSVACLEGKRKEPRGGRGREREEKEKRSVQHEMPVAFPCCRSRSWGKGGEEGRGLRTRDHCLLSSFSKKKTQEILGPGHNEVERRRGKYSIPLFIPPLPNIEKPSEKGGWGGKNKEKRLALISSTSPFYFFPVGTAPKGRGLGEGGEGEKKRGKREGCGARAHPLFQRFRAQKRNRPKKGKRGKRSGASAGHVLFLQSAPGSDTPSLERGENCGERKGGKRKKKEEGKKKKG